MRGASPAQILTSGTVRRDCGVLRGSRRADAARGKSRTKHRDGRGGAPTAYGTGRAEWQVGRVSLRTERPTPLRARAVASCLRAPQDMAPFGVAVLRRQRAHCWCGGAALGGIGRCTDESSCRAPSLTPGSGAPYRKHLTDTWTQMPDAGDPRVGPLGWFRSAQCVRKGGGLVSDPPFKKAPSALGLDRSLAPPGALFRAGRTMRRV